MNAFGRRSAPLQLLSVLSLGLCLGGPALGARDDALKQFNITSERGGRVDLVRQRTEFIGNVVASRGSMVLKAERMDVQESSDGFIQAYAHGDVGVAAGQILVLIGEAKLDHQSRMGLHQRREHSRKNRAADDLAGRHPDGSAQCIAPAAGRPFQSLRRRGHGPGLGQ